MLSGIALLALVPMAFVGGDPPQKNEKDAKVAFTFAGSGYVFRYKKDGLREYTPKGQPDLKKWTDMLTVNEYATIKDGEGLASAANSVLETYKANKAVVVKTSSVPRTDKKEAEHLIVVLFPQPDFIEAAFARFVMNKGVGHSVVYSHRIYGKKAGDAMSKWLLANGEKREKALMGMVIPAK